MLPNTGCQAQKVLMQGSVLKSPVIPTTLRSRSDGGRSSQSFAVVRTKVNPGGVRDVQTLGLFQFSHFRNLKIVFW